MIQRDGIRPKGVLFVRIGWMNYYQGRVPGDDKPRRGGSHNVDEIGWEVFNFKTYRGELRGYIHGPLLRRIDPTYNRRPKYLKDVLVIFFATKPHGGQVIIGWYNNARVFHSPKKHDWPDRESKYEYSCEALARDAVLLPTEGRDYPITSGKGRPGTSNLFYIFHANGTPRREKWIQETIDYVLNYDGPNWVKALEEEIADEIESTVAAAAGFISSSFARTAIEKLAMDRAMAYFEQDDWLVEDVSRTESFDLRCEKDSKILRVEVKGTQSKGETIQLTPNEVKNAREYRSQMVLFILHSVKIKGEGADVEATGGRFKVIRPWDIDRGVLKPISYFYELESKRK
jgi:hypothetical protein